MRIISSILLICSFLCANANNYTISGKVVNNKTNEGLPYINVGIEGSTNGAMTNEKGSFLITGIGSGEQILIVSSVGYKAVKKKIIINGNINNAVIRLEEESFELDQVVVTATRSERLLKDVPIATQIISSKSLEKMQVSTFRDVLEYEMPGVEFNNNGGYANINMLGFGGKYVLFLLDGERMAGETFDNIDYNRIDMDNIERIEIVKGASSSLYGSNAIGGVINIISKKPVHSLQVQAGARYGSHNEQNLNLLLSSRQKWGALSISGSYKKMNPYELKLPQAIKDGVVKDSLNYAYVAGYTDYSLTPKLTFKLGDKWEFEAKASYFFKERNPGGMDARVRNRFYDYSGGLKANYKITENQHLSLSGNYDRFDKYEYYKLLNEEEKNYENSQIRIGGIYDWLIAGKHSLVAGVEYLSDDLMTFMFESDGKNENRDAQTYSAFTQQEWAIHDKVTLVTGLRYDYHSQFKGHLTPRLSFMYRPVKELTFRGGYAGGFRSPTLKELYTNWYHEYGHGFQIIGNKDMKAEKSNNFNLAAELNLGNTQLTGMAQYSIIDEKISSIWKDNSQKELLYVNMGKVKVISTEFTVSHRFGKDLFLRGTYAYVHDDLGTKSITRPHSATIRADYTTGFLKNYNPTISLSGKYFGRMNIYGSTTDEEDDSGVSTPVTVEHKTVYDDYSIWRLTLTCPLPYNLSVNAGVNNLLDYKPKFFSFYSSIASGRTFYIGLRWQLK